VRLCLDPRAEVGLGAALGEIGEGGLVMAVGPEGGLTDEELAAAEEAGMTRVTLGGLVLRTETVCAAVLGAVLAFGQVRVSRGG